MMNKFLGLALTALLTGGLVVMPAVASAESRPQAKHPGVLHVYGNNESKLFTADGIKRAETTLGNTQFDHGLTVTVDTYAEPPADKKVAATAAAEAAKGDKGDKAKWHDFMAGWA